MKNTKALNNLIKYLSIFIGGGLLAFGLYNVHDWVGITEGGTLGFTLFLKHFTGISPGITLVLLNIICFAIGWKVLGVGYFLDSLFASFCFFVFYISCEQFCPIWVELIEMPWLAAFIGAIFVGVGVSLCIRVNSAPTGDDILAVALSKVTKRDISIIYFVSDFIVLILSTSYIGIENINVSMVTCFLSGQIISFLEKIGMKKNMFKNCMKNTQVFK